MYYANENYLYLGEIEFLSLIHIDLGDLKNKMTIGVSAPKLKLGSFDGIRTA